MSSEEPTYEALKAEVERYRKDVPIIAELSGKAFFLITALKQRDYFQSPNVERLSTELREVLYRYNPIFGKSSVSSTSGE